MSITTSETANLPTADLSTDDTLRGFVRQSLRSYFSNLDGIEPKDLYDMVMHEVEGPFFEAVMEFTKNNQSRAARVMGISRGTLRKKLKEFGLLE